MLGLEALDIDALADALREDGVVIDRVMGSGEAQESHDRISELIKEVPFPVYVALVQQPRDLRSSGTDANEVLATLLRRRIGGEGLFLVHSTAGTARVEAYGLGASSTRVSLANYDNVDALRTAAQNISTDHLWIPAVVHAEATVRTAEAMVALASEDVRATDFRPTLEGDELDLLADRAVEMSQTARWRPGIANYRVEQASATLSGLLAGMGGLAAALVLGQTLRGWPRLRPGTAPQKRTPNLVLPAVAEEARLAREELTAFVERVAQSAPNGSAADVMARVLAAREAAERHVDAKDPAAIVGVRTLVRTGERDLTRALTGAGKSYAPCFFDPRHPESSGRVGWRLGEGQIRVPCCRACARDIEAGRTPQILAVRHLRRLVPYYTRDDVWARTGFGTLTDTFASDVLKERS